MKVLVTGGSGFIGSHLIDQLLSEGHSVINVDDCSANNDQFYFNHHAKNYKFSILDTEKLLKVSKGCDIVFHLAAESRLQLATQNPKRAVDVNIGGTLSVLQCCRQHNMGIVFSSTSSVYGFTDNLPILESHNEKCMNPYASTKYSAELLIRNYHELHGVKSAILRYFNVFGERAPSLGQYALVTSIFLKQRKQGLPLTVVGDGTQKRDFIYVKDIVSANILCAKNLDYIGYDIFNVGSGTEVSIIDLAKQISDDIIFIEKRSGEVINNLSSSEKLQSKLGWKPTTYILEWIKG
jgi:UDP-glucose 4-epimerase